MLWKAANGPLDFFICGRRSIFGDTALPGCPESQYDVNSVRFVGAKADEVISTMDSVSTANRKRACGSCTLCCKLVGIAELNKPMGQWCRHRIKRKGCCIYDARPNECRNFNCGWLTTLEFGDEWKPSRSNMVICHQRSGDMYLMTVLVDPVSPLAWKGEPYYSQLKRMALNGIKHGGVINISIGKRVIAIMPDKDLDFGDCDPSDRFTYEKHWTGSAWDIKICKVPGSAPAG